MRAAALALALAFAIALASDPARAQPPIVSLDDIVAPERTAAERPFPLRVNLTNHGAAARTVYLFAALYGPGHEGDCGPATDPRFKTFTPLLQARLQLEAGQSASYPAPRDAWLQSYEPTHVPPQPSVSELCVFVAEDEAPGSAALRYLDFASVPLSTRGQNRAPTADFKWAPLTPVAAEDARFAATGDDADGDPLSFRWDFGHFNASGRATAQGAEATHFFFPEGEYQVTLVASDGFDDARVVKSVRVLPEVRASPPPAGTSPTPLPLLVTLAAAAAAAAALRRR